MGKFEHYISRERILKAFEDTIQKRNLSAGRDRFTKQNLKIYFEESDSIKNYHSFLNLGYSPRKFVILRDPKIELSNDKNIILGKMRIMCKPSIFDRPAYLILKEYLNDIHTLKINSKNIPSEIIKNIVNQINDVYSNGTESNYFIIKTDVSSFYANINHNMLLNELKNKYHVETAPIKFIKNTFDKYIESFDNLNILSEMKNPEEEVKKTDFTFSINFKNGIPQGLPISSVLAEMFIDGIELSIKRTFKKICRKVSVYRYVDDIFIIVKTESDIEILKDIVNQISFKGLRFNSNKTKIINLSNMSDLKGLDLIGFNLKYNRSDKVESIIGKAKLSQFINGLEKKFSDFGKKYEKIHKLIPNEELSIDKIIDKKTAEIIRFRNDIDLDITGYLGKKDNKKMGYGWIHYYKDVSNPSAFKLVDEMIEKFKNRVPGLDKVKFKSALITYRYIKDKMTDKNLYIPDLNALSSTKDDQLLNEFLYDTMVVKYYKILEMSHSEKIRLLNSYLMRNGYGEELIDISRGRTLYVEIDKNI